MNLTNEPRPPRPSSNSRNARIHGSIGPASHSCAPIPRNSSDCLQSLQPCCCRCDAMRCAFPPFGNQSVTGRAASRDLDLPVPLCPRHPFPGLRLSCPIWPWPSSRTNKLLSKGLPRGDVRPWPDGARFAMSHVPCHVRGPSPSMFMSSLAKRRESSSSYYGRATNAVGCGSSPMACRW